MFSVIHSFKIMKRLNAPTHPPFPPPQAVLFLFNSFSGPSSAILEPKALSDVT